MTSKQKIAELETKLRRYTLFKTRYPKSDENDPWRRYKQVKKQVFGNSEHLLFFVPW